MNLANYFERLCYISSGIFLLLISLPASVLADSCSEAVAKSVSIQGVVEVRYKSAAVWQKVTAKQSFCVGDMIRTGANSRAAFYLNNDTILRLNERSAVSFTDISPQQRSWLGLEQGVAHFISRIKQSFEVVTPYVNAAVDGTEFVVSVVDNFAEVTVLEGRVRVSNDRGEVSLSNGQTVVANAGGAPTLRAQVRPWDAVRWALHYPVIVDVAALLDVKLNEPWQGRLAQSVGYYREGDVSSALSELDSLEGDLANSDVYVYRAALYLAVGQVTRASSDVEAALQLEESNGEAIALKAIIAVVNNETGLALTLAQDAVAASADALSPLLAMSYAQQAVFDLKQARQTIEQAVMLTSQSALAWARLAELQLMFGELDHALAAARRAAEIAPNLARTQSVLGFAHLTRIDIDAAEQAFHQAIQLDQADPLSRLGLGLTLIRRGELDAGRRQIEYAASLDPANPLIRSYLGKAYYEEKRNQLAADQLNIAKKLDPNDPTPWFYDAIRKQNENSPVEALHDLRKSIELNDNRAVYRSRLLLDQDLAARSAAQALVYENLSLEQLALLEGWKSVNTDPTNFSAHRFLADSYAVLPRHEIARVSELLQSQLLQPINIAPVLPQLAQTDLAILGGVGPANLSSNEFNPLFNHNGVTLLANGVTGSNGTWGEDTVLSAIQGRFYGSIGQFHYQTDGFRKNDDLEQDVYNAFMQVLVNPRLSIQGELRSETTEAGDVTLFFNDFHRPDFREKFKQDTTRVGGRYKLAADKDIIFSAIYGDITDSETNLTSAPPPLSFVGRRDDTVESDGYHVELQYIFQSKRFKTIAGTGYVDLDGQAITKREVLQDGVPLPESTIIRTFDSETRHFNAYAYAPLSITPNTTVILGASYDSFEEEPIGLDEDQVNPKFGVIWQASRFTSVRFAAFRVLKRSLISNQTVEPSQVAGFNQFFDDLDGADSQRYGLGLDHTLTSSLFTGVELSWRDVDSPLISQGSTIKLNQDESFHRLYLYWLPHSTVALSAEYRFEGFDKEVLSGQENQATPRHVETQNLPLSVSYYRPNGFFAKAITVYVYQDTDTGVDRGKDNFWVTDLSVGYRLPNRHGLIGLDIKNLFDEDFQFQSAFDTRKPRLSEFQPERSVFIKARLSF